MLYFGCVTMSMMMLRSCQFALAHVIPKRHPTTARPKQDYVAELPVNQPVNNPCSTSCYGMSVLYKWFNKTDSQSQPNCFQSPLHRNALPPPIQLFIIFNKLFWTTYFDYKMWLWIANILKHLNQRLDCTVKQLIKVNNCRHRGNFPLNIIGILPSPIIRK